MESSPPPVSPVGTSPPARPRRISVMIASGAGLVVLATIAGLFLTRNFPGARGTTPAAGTGGCPPAIAAPWHTAANEAITASAANSVTTARVGDTVEIDLDAAYRWDLVAAPAALQVLPPSGAFDSARNLCVWRFTVAAAGTSTVKFQRREIATPGRLTSPLIINYGFVIATAPTAQRTP